MHRCVRSSRYEDTHRELIIIEDLDAYLVEEMARRFLVRGFDYIQRMFDSGWQRIS